MGVLAQYLKEQFTRRIRKKRPRRAKPRAGAWQIQFFNYRPQSAKTDEKEQPLNESYSVRELIKGPLGGTEHLRLRKSKHKNVRRSLDCEKNLELMIGFSFEDADAFNAFKNRLLNKDFIGLETKKYFLQNFIENEASKAFKLFENKLGPGGFSPKDFSNSFKRSIDKHEISNMMRQQLGGSPEEVSCSQLFQLNDTNRVNSSHFMGESNLFLLGDSKKNSMGLFRGHDSQFMSILNGKDTPGDPSNLALESHKLTPIFTKRAKEELSQMQLTPIRASNSKPKTRADQRGFRDLKTIRLEPGKHGPEPIMSNFIFHNENTSRGFELTQKDAEPSANLEKRAKMFSEAGKGGKVETPVYDFKNVTKKIYGVDTLQKVKRKAKTRGKAELGKESLELFLMEERGSRKENKGKKESAGEDAERENSNLGKYSNSVNTGKSTKKYDEGLLNLYSKV